MSTGDAVPPPDAARAGNASRGPDTTVVIPTIGRPSLAALLAALSTGTRPVDVPVLVVDDRAPDATGALDLGDAVPPHVAVLRSGGGGPARARNVGWRHARTGWVSFLDDDVLPAADWFERLTADLAVPQTVAGTQGRVDVPLPTDRAPRDWERTTAGLRDAQWITADLSYRRTALAAVGGFDERFPRAFREDADLGLRISRTQGTIVTGSRLVTHPVRLADDWVSVRTQAGNADDFLMRRLHGARWRQAAGASKGRRGRHMTISAASAAALLATTRRRRRLATGAALLAVSGITELAWARIRPGPRDGAEVRRMLLTSAVLPFAATWHSVRGAWRHRRAAPWCGVPELVLFDRDGTLVHDVPYNGDPALVDPVPDAAAALDRLRRAGVRVGVVSNQSGIGSGRITHAQADAVNARIEALLGPFETWQYCPHASDAGCRCRKPEPGLVHAACATLGVEPARSVVVGDIGSDVLAAERAGARGILVPTAQTRPQEVAEAAQVAGSLTEAVERILRGAC